MCGVRLRWFYSRFYGSVFKLVSVSNHCGNKMHKSESYKPLESFIFVCTVEIFGIDLISFLSFKTVNCKCPLLFVFLGWDLTDLSVVFSVFCSSAMTVSDRGKFAFNCDWSNVVLVCVSFFSDKCA